MNTILFLLYNFIYRSNISEPLMYLYNGLPLTKEELKDENISKRLHLLGYNGISDLDNYYIDYFNKNYRANATSLNDLDTALVEKIYPSNTNISIKETNNILNEALGRVDIYYIDYEGNYLLPRNTIQSKIDSQYTTKPLSIDGYELKTIRGNTTGTYKNVIQEVYYIYDTIDSKEVSNFYASESVPTNNDILILPIIICFLFMWLMLKIIQYKK